MGPPTLAACRDYGLMANCEKCQHHAVLDLDQLIAKLGADFIAIGLNGHLRCQRCGELGGKITVVPPRSGFD